ncbi:MAG TPA: hypothetical protein VEW04_06180 [Allosphingosinicella sp.]|nr:hypothetical protein [Allosphingosinicella sp.]
MSATNWLAADASSRRSEPTASTKAATASGVVVPPARRISARTKSIRSAGLVILLQATIAAPAFVIASATALFLAPPAWCSTKVTPSTGSAT